MNMRAPIVFRILLFSFVLGVSAGSFFYVTSPVVPFLFLSVGFIVLGAWPDRHGILAFGVVAVFSIGFFHVSQTVESVWSEGRTGSISGRAEVVRSPRQKDFFHEAVFRMTECSSWCPSGEILVRLPLLQEVSYGERGRFSCDLSLPEGEWRMYYAKEGISHICKNPEWAAEGRFTSFLSPVFLFSESFESSLGRFLPEPESSLAAGMLLGGEGRLPKDVKENFRTAGLSHIVAVSGYNISILAGYLLLIGIACFLPRKRAAIFAFIGTVLFVVVSGSPPSAVRAIGMASSLMLSWWLGRRYGSLSAVLFAGVFMLAWNPLLMRFDLGFLLSFSATIGIILLGPFIGVIIRDTPFFSKLFFEAFFLTIAAEVFILPIIFMNFGGFSLVAFPVNAALLPLVPFSMLFSFLSGIAGMFSSWLGSILAFPAYLVLHAIVSGAEYAASFREATMISWESFGWGQVFFWYFLVFSLIIIFSRKIRKKTSPPSETNRISI